jgi:glycosyltransferase involved in cell wall biosynthesis
VNYEATAILTNYSRPDNIEKIISCLRNQTVSVEIIMINNSDTKDKYEVDLQIDASKNLMCFPRWFACNYASSPYVFSLDDDLMFSDDNVIADCIQYSKENQCAVGGFGVVLLNNFNYWKSRHVETNSKTSFEVNIIKGRFLFTPKHFLKNVPLISSDPISHEAPRFEDDIFVSSYINKKIIPTFLANRLIELPQGEFSLFKQPDHRESRSAATTKYFNKNESN